VASKDRHGTRRVLLPASRTSNKASLGRLIEWCAAAWSRPTSLHPSSLPKRRFLEHERGLVVDGHSGRPWSARPAEPGRLRCQGATLPFHDRARHWVNTGSWRLSVPGSQRLQASCCMANGQKEASLLEAARGSSPLHTMYAECICTWWKPDSKTRAWMNRSAKERAIKTACKGADRTQGSQKRLI